MKIIQINFVKLDGSQMRGAPRVGLEIDLAPALEIDLAPALEAGGLLFTIRIHV